MIGLLLTTWLASLAPPGLPTAAEGTPPRLRSGSISNGDYPASAIRAGEQGSVRIILDVASYGGVTNCRVDRSSGSAALDATSCLLATQRFKFDAARNASGRRVASTYSQSIRWVLPGDAGADLTAMLPVFGSGQMRLAFSRDSMGTRCAIEMSGEAFTAGADLLCPVETRISLNEMMRDSSAMLTVTTLTPEGSPPSEGSPVRGILLARLASDIEVAPDGSLASCRDLDVPGPRSMPLPSFCQATNMPFPAFRPDASGQTRRGRVQLEIYRLGAPET